MPNCYPLDSEDLYEGKNVQKYPGPMANLPNIHHQIDYFFIEERDMHEYIANLREIIETQARDLEIKTNLLAQAEEKAADLQKKLTSVEQKNDDLEKEQTQLLRKLLG